MNIDQYNRIKQLLSFKKDIVIIPHKNPDGDAIGSCTGLKFYLDKLGHNSSIISPNKYPQFLEWLDSEKKIIIYNDVCEVNNLILNADIIFTLDFNNLVRISQMKEVVEKSDAIKIMIDHHENPSDYACLLYTSPSPRDQRGSRMPSSA